MSAPLATPDDLATFLGIDSIDYARAALILQFAQSKCERVVSPIPADAIDIVVAVAARGFSNPEGVLSETVGPYTVQRGAANLYLTRQERADLRRLAGLGGGFSIDTLPTGVNAVQLVTVTATGGTFKLALSGQSTTPLAYNASSGDVLAALNALSLIGAGNVTVTGVGPYTVTFVNSLKTTPVPTMTADGSGLTGTGAIVTVVTTTVGVFAPGQGLAPWDRDYFQNNTAVGMGGGELY